MLIAEKAHIVASAIKCKHKLSKSYQYNDVLTVNAIQKVLEMLNNNEHSKFAEASPQVTLPGFRKSPIEKQLRVTDYPFPLKDDGDSQVGKVAEEFIMKFYEDLNLQKTMVMLIAAMCAFSSITQLLGVLTLSLILSFVFFLFVKVVHS